MHKISRRILQTGLMLTAVTLSLNSHAIHIKVKSSSNHVFALGFTVDGKKFGGLGHSYVNDNAPKGHYRFGLKAGRDVACPMKNGKNEIHLIKDSSVLLKYNGEKCCAEIL